MLRSARVAVDAAEHLPIELEGEQVGTTPAVFELVPGALRVRVPRLNGRRSRRPNASPGQSRPSSRRG